MAEVIARGVAGASVAVVSGAARGIDAAAHRGALAADGSTAAVLGSGIDVPYPSSNAGLIEEIARRGVVLSEYPPGSRAHPQRFPARNRIVAGLSHALLVVEGAHGSGSMISVEHAQSIGIDVLAVPGPVTSPLSAVPLELLREHAGLVRGPEDVLASFGLEVGIPGRAPEVTRREAEVLRAMGGGPAPAETIARAASIAVPAALSVLVSLELRGLVRAYAGRYEPTMPGRAAALADPEMGEGPS